MRPAVRGALALGLLALLPGFVLQPASADAAFGFLSGAAGFESRPIAEGGGPADLSGSHPYELTTTIGLEGGPEAPGQPGVPFSDGDLRDLTIEEPPGMIENADAVPKCSVVAFDTQRVSPFEEPSHSGESCPADTQIGVVDVESSFGEGSSRSFGVFNLVPSPGVPSEIGFAPFGVPITLDSRIRDAEGEYGLTLGASNLPQRLDITGFRIILWGYPWAASHNGERGNCLNEGEPSFPWAKCSVGRPSEYPPLPYLTLPTSCEAPLHFTATADSWQTPGTVVAESTPFELQGCQSLLFGPQPEARFTNPRASSPSGFEFDLVSGGESPTSHRVPSQDRTAVVSLPEGVTLNPSVGAGLGVCTPEQYAAETASSPPGAGCPNSSKIGEFTVQTPLFEEAVGGAIFLAQPFHNPTNSLLALYLVAKSPERGILVKVAGHLEADGATGRLTAIFENLPQIPYTNLEVQFRESQRAPLVTPTTCGTYETHMHLTPWLGSLGSYELNSPSQVSAGIGGSACPGSVPPVFQPQADGGTLNANAGSYTPFYLHLTRTDTEQEITSYSAELPPGLLGKIAGIPYCSDAAIEVARQASGTEELEHPSCPAASQIGHTISGYGVGSTLAYAPGNLYLAGPYHGAPLSIVAIDSAMVGPFDLGTVIVRSAIEVDSHDAQVSIDSSASDPIPHIIDGIPLHLRDIRIYLSRPDFTVNPTNCSPFSLISTLTGSSAPFTNPDGARGAATVPFQVSYCSSLNFKPKLGLREKGRVRRAGIPALTATVTARPGDANIAAATVTLPHALFLEQAHIRKVCTIPQLEANRCPAGSAYGHASVTTPLLAAPMAGPVYLTSNRAGHGIPELAVALEGQGISILLDGHIDTFHGGIRTIFEGLPDAPIERFSLTMYGGKRGVLINAADICPTPPAAIVKLIGQNAGSEIFRTRLQANCKKTAGQKGHTKARKHR